MSPANRTSKLRLLLHQFSNRSKSFAFDAGNFAVAHFIKFIRTTSNRFFRVVKATGNDNKRKNISEIERIAISKILDIGRESF